MNKYFEANYPGKQGMITIGIMLLIFTVFMCAKGG